MTYAGLLPASAGFFSLARCQGLTYDAPVGVGASR